ATASARLREALLNLALFTVLVHSGQPKGIAVSATFSRTLRSLEADGPRRRLASLGVAVLLAGWSAWSFLGRVAVYEVSASARLEVQSAAHCVAAPVGGKVARTDLAIGREVDAGEVLVVLDSEAESRAVAERRRRCEALEARRQPLRGEIQAEREAL